MNLRAAVRGALLSLALLVVLACLNVENSPSSEPAVAKNRSRLGRVLYGSGYYRLPTGRTWRNGRYYGNFNNRYYGPQYGYF